MNIAIRPILLAVAVLTATLAAVAWYHDALPGPRPPELAPFLEEVEQWALND